MTEPECRAQYQRPGGRLVGDRIVDCNRPSDHDGDHEEADTEVTWPRDTPQPRQAGEPLNVPPEPHAQDETEHPADAARRYAGEVWRLASGLADRGIPLDPDMPIDTAPVDTALAAIDELVALRVQDVIFPDGTHRYWSTHCRHAGPSPDDPRHADCSAKWLHGTTVMDGVTTAIVRMPAQCKTCGAPCRCHCHKIAEPRHPVSPAPGYRPDGTPIGTLE